MSIKIPDGQMLQQVDADAMLEYMNYLPDLGRMVEIGTGYGHSAKFFSQAKPNWTIYTIDGYGSCGDGRIYKTFDSKAVTDVCSYINNTSVIQMIGNSNNIKWELYVDVIYLDGGHSYDCVKADFENFSPHLKKNGYIFLHDYHREDFGVKKLVDELVASGEWILCFSHKVAIIRKKITIDYNETN